MKKKTELSSEIKQYQITMHSAQWYDEHINHTVS